MVNMQKENCRMELREAIRHLQDRGLYVAAKWAGELLIGIDEEERMATPSPALMRSDRGSSVSGSITLRRERRLLNRASAAATSAAAGTSATHELLRGAPPVAIYAGASPATAGRSGGLPALPSASSAVTPSTAFDSPAALPEPEIDSDRYLCAKTIFDTREYKRAAYFLKDAPGKKAFFLRCYSLYLAGEKRKEEEALEDGGALGKPGPTNKELPALEQDLSACCKSGTLDAFGMYLYGVILRENEQNEAARNMLVKSVNTYPWNWSAWLELQALCSDMSVLSGLELREHWMKEFFVASTLLELQKNIEGLKKYGTLQDFFPVSHYISGQVASALYNSRDYDQAENLYTDILRNDPYRIDYMDTFSNILYVKENFAHLSHLAHRVFSRDKYRPESCCIIGNYYSLKGLHEKAVMYFKRALKLNRKYLSAWTLMGHEYVEMKNTPAAIDAYRRAVEVSPRDYRAWYGLGQTYEILQLPYYALYYYRQSAFLRPDDARMWVAIGNCYESEHLQMYDNAIKCYIRALKHNDNEGIALYKLAKLHHEIGHDDLAAHYHKKNLERLEKEQYDSPEVIEALYFLANYYKQRKDTEKAEMYCSRLLDFGGPEKHSAKDILRELKSGENLAMDFEQTPP